jgi:hypothetical protein
LKFRFPAREFSLLLLLSKKEMERYGYTNTAAPSNWLWTNGSANKNPRPRKHESIFTRRMLVDMVWHQRLTEDQRAKCGGEETRSRVKKWVSTTLDCEIDESDVFQMIMAFDKKN